jgi:hypothetical protein
MMCVSFHSVEIKTLIKWCENCMTRNELEWRNRAEVWLFAMQSAKQLRLCGNQQKKYHLRHLDGQRSRQLVTWFSLKQYFPLPNRV